MLVHPQFDPAVFTLKAFTLNWGGTAHSFGPFALHWYGIMYMVGFAAFLFLARRQARKTGFITEKQVEDLLFYGILGVILGGRLGYVLFYKPGDYFAHPLDIIKIWEGGMSFHGGFIGVLVAMVFFARSVHKPWLQIMDFLAPYTPIGLGAGRLGNFINGELWGRVTAPDAFWAMRFPQALAADQKYVQDNPQWLPVYQQYGGLARHPSELYEMALEGFVLYLLMWWFCRRPRRTAAVSSLFLIGYGVFRFTAEFAREPDDFLGLRALQLSQGQWLSLPMIVSGVVIMAWAYRKKS